MNTRMTKPASGERADLARLTRCHRNYSTALRIALRPWGFDACVVQSWINALPTLDRAIAWEIATDRRAPGADIVVHVVRPAPAARGQFCWNGIGANYALRQSLAACGTELALLIGDSNQMPAECVGHWVAAGALPPAAALARLGRLIAACAAPQQQTQPPVRRTLMRLISRDLDMA
ncbi:hypothetical protein [Burkholderia cepacia]|nr:hypothetical protein [Burkholderia cepacia]MCE4129876.1 hypothetical protein [Burkholderia cepacia]MDN7856307.1 hypothetical protein [Burkholderia cepacia]